MESYKTIQEEMKELGIEPQFFNTIYHQLSRSHHLPSEDTVPPKQYVLIVDYLRNKQILGENNQIQPEGLKIFDSKVSLEFSLASGNPPIEDIFTSSHGGIAPCRSEPKSSGGIFPCRN